MIDAIAGMLTISQNGDVNINTGSACCLLGNFMSMNRELRLQKEKNRELEADKDQLREKMLSLSFHIKDGEETRKKMAYAFYALDVSHTNLGFENHELQDQNARLRKDVESLAWNLRARVKELEKERKQYEQDFYQELRHFDLDSTLSSRKVPKTSRL